MKSTFDILRRGLVALRLNTHYLFVVVLLIVFPLLFVYITESIFDVASQNHATVEKQQLSLIHHSIIRYVTDGVPEKISSLIDIVPTLTGVVVYETSNNDYHTVTTVGIIDSTGSSQLSVFSGLAHIDGAAYIHELHRPDGVRMWRAYQKFTVDDSPFLLVTEHSFKSIDTLLMARQQQVYLGLSFIFVFLLAVTYWLVRQENWARAYATVAKQRDEQVMFTNTVAHELRAPLTVIKGYTSLLRESPSLAEPELSHADKIALSTERLIVLINDFLEVARIQAGRIVVKKQPVLLTAMVENLLQNFAPLAKAKGVTISLQGLRNVSLETDETRLTQILTNLLSNAVKYTDKGSVVVTIDQTRLKTSIKIQDTGRGISADDQRKLFQPFSRVGNAETTGVPGSGLGMWITKQLAELLQGTITIESIEGVGTAVKVTFKT